MGDNNNSDTSESDDLPTNRPTVWTKDHENILIDWADKAMCYRWLHAKANQKFKKLNTWFTVPVIIMSTITGTANFASEKVPVEYRSYYSSAIGGINIIAGIITTVQQFLKISELNEAHRVSSISWDKFYRKIRVELAKPPEERVNIYDFLKSCTEEFDRLMETSPIIDKYVIQKFQKTFTTGKKVSDKAREMFDQLKKPEICDVLESVRFSVYKEDEGVKKELKLKNLIKDVVTNVDDGHMGNKKLKIISDFHEHFKTELMREPTREELMDNLVNEDINIDESIIDKYLANKKINLKKSLMDGAVDIEMGIQIGDLKDVKNQIQKAKNEISDSLISDPLNSDSDSTASLNNEEL